MVGVPGRSNALAIAKRLGMPQPILNEAAGMIDPDDQRADSLLQDIRRRRDETEEALRRAKARSKRLNGFATRSPASAMPPSRNASRRAKKRWIRPSSNLLKFETRCAVCNGTGK